MDWERFEFEYRFKTKNLLRLLVTIEAYREAALNLVLPPDWREQLDRLNRVRAIHGTTALEGNPLSEQQVAESLHGEGGNNHQTREQIDHECRSSAGLDQIQIREGPRAAPASGHFGDAPTDDRKVRDQQRSGKGFGPFVWLWGHRLWGVSIVRHRPLTSPA